MNFATILVSAVLIVTSGDQVFLRGGSILSGTVEHRDALGLRLRTADGRILFLTPEEVERVQSDDSEEKNPEYIRFREKGDRGDALQSAVGIYLLPSTGQVVSLVGAVHVGDKSYYKRLQDLLDAHKIVLFEGVGGDDPSALDPKEVEEFGFVTRMQLRMGKLLDLSFQKDHIDYTRSHFHNADLNLNEVNIALDERNQTLLPMQDLLRAMVPPKSDHEEDEKEEDFLDKTGHRKKVSAEMKRSFGRILANAPQLLAQMGMHDPENRTDVIISMRNDAAFKILKESLAEGNETIAVFYGAAHLLDMHQILVNEMGFIRKAHRWLDAWSIPPSSVGR